MQFRFATLLAVVVLATVAAASPEAGVNSIGMRSAAGVKAHGHVSVEHSARHGIKNIQDDLELLEVMHHNNDKSKSIKAAIYADLQKNMKSASANLLTVVNSANKRDASTEDLVADLVKDLNKVLCKVHKFLKELLDNLGADQIEKELAEPLYKGLKSVVHELEAGLTKAAPQLAKLLDPILNGLATTVKALGLRDVEEEELVERKEKVNSKKGKAELRLTAEVNAQLEIVKKDLKALKKLEKSGKAGTAEGKKLIKSILKHAGEAGKTIKHILAKAKKEGIKISAGHNDKRADDAEGEFEHLLYRAVHDLVCILHAVLKLSFNLLKNLGLDGVEDILKEVDAKALEPLFDGLKELSKQLGAGLSPLLDPVLGGLDDLLVKLGIDL